MRRLSPSPWLGTVLGAASMVSNLGLALRPVVGGWLDDQDGSHAWMSIGSLAGGRGAVAIALGFPRTGGGRFTPAMAR